MSAYPDGLGRLGRREGTEDEVP